MSVVLWSSFFLLVIILPVRIKTVNNNKNKKKRSVTIILGDARTVLSSRYTETLSLLLSLRSAQSLHQSGRLCRVGIKLAAP